VDVTIGGVFDSADVAFLVGLTDNSRLSEFGEEIEFSDEIVSAGEDANVSGDLDLSVLLHPVTGIKTMKRNRKIMIKFFFNLYCLYNSLLPFFLNSKNPPFL
jgi:hypothetical protein